MFSDCASVVTEQKWTNHMLQFTSLLDRTGHQLSYSHFTNRTTKKKMKIWLQSRAWLSHTYSSLYLCARVLHLSTICHVVACHGSCPYLHFSFVTKDAHGVYTKKASCGSLLSRTSKADLSFVDAWVCLCPVFLANALRKEFFLASFVVMKVVFNSWFCNLATAKINKTVNFGLLFPPSTFWIILLRSSMPCFSCDVF